MATRRRYDTRCPCGTYCCSESPSLKVVALEPEGCSLPPLERAPDARLAANGRSTATRMDVEPELTNSATRPGLGRSVGAVSVACHPRPRAPAPGSDLACPHVCTYLPTSVCDSVAPSRSPGGLRGPWSPDVGVVDVPPSSKGGKFEPYYQFESRPDLGRNWGAADGGPCGVRLRTPTVRDLRPLVRREVSTTDGSCATWLIFDNSGSNVHYPLARVRTSSNVPRPPLIELAHQACVRARASE